MNFKNFYSKKIIFFISLILGLFLYSDSALAAATYNSLVQIPLMPANPSVFKYLNGLYTFLTGVVGIVAMGAIVIGGARYLTSAGNPSAIEDAKHTIYSAIYGLILALASWVIISTINPDILVLKKPGVSMTDGTFGFAARDPLYNCMVPGEQNNTTSPCHCVDNPKQNVTFTQPAITGPYVVSTSVPACSVGVDTNLNSITITFSEAMDAASITTATITPALQPCCAVNTSFAVSLTSPNVVTATWTGTLDSNGAQSITVTSNVKSAKGIAMTSDYVLKFLTGDVWGTPCTPPPPAITTCKSACAFPNTKDLKPAGYHCAKADLKAGTSAASVNIDETVNIKVGDTVYFDAKTYSRNSLAPNFKVDVPSTDPAFHNGVDSYIMQTQLLAGTDPKWPSSEVLWGLQYDYFWTVPASGCTWWASFATYLVSGIANTFGGSNVEGMVTSKYTKTGEYKAILNTYVLDSNGVCQGPFIDRVYVNVN